MRSIVAIAVIGLCLWGMAQTGRRALARFHSSYSRTTSSFASAEDGVRYDPSDPEAFYVRGVLLEQSNDYAGAIRDLERATELRPADYLLWLELGRARQFEDDEVGAREAFQRSVKLAPYAVDPRWQLGNALLRAGRFDEAFVELRRAAAGDSTLLPVVFDLAWNAYSGNLDRFEHAIQLDRSGDRIALAHFVLQRGNPAAAVALFKATNGVSAEQRGSFVSALLSVKRFHEAYEVWSGGVYRAGLGVIANGDFEGEFAPDEGFGWKFDPQLENVSARLDVNEARSGKRSVVLQFTGSSNPGTPLLSQMVLIEPDTSYQLHLAAKTEDLVTGGIPSVVITNPEASDGGLLAQTALPVKAYSWQDLKLNFHAPKDVVAIRIAIQRQACAQQPCPAMGSVWLDDFSLRKL